MPKQKCRANRKKRLKWDKKNLERIAEKKLFPYVSKIHNGLNPDYYRLRVIPKIIWKGRQRYIDLRKSRYSLVKNEKYREIIRTILNYFSLEDTKITVNLVQWDEPFANTLNRERSSPAAELLGSQAQGGGDGFGASEGAAHGSDTGSGADTGNGSGGTAAGT